MSRLNVYFRQYGFVRGTKLLIFRMFQFLIGINVQYILKLDSDGKVDPLIIENGKCIKILEWNNSEAISLINREIKKNEICFVYQIEGNTAGYAFIQKGGLYKFGMNYIVNLPTDVYMLKNLFVNPSYRGNGVGLKLNLARAEFVRNKKVALVLVMKENLIALRNLQKVGFKKVLIVSHWNFLKFFNMKQVKSIDKKNLHSDLEAIFYE